MPLAPSARSVPAALAVARVERDGEVARVAALTRDFVTLVAASGYRRRAEASAPAPVVLFEGWLERAAASGVRVLTTFAAGLRQDGAAVRAALTLPWSSGQAEGQINRLEFLKRQMDGRAGFDLRRRRVLLIGLTSTQLAGEPKTGTGVVGTLRVNLGILVISVTHAAASSPRHRLVSARINPPHRE